MTEPFADKWPRESQFPIVERYHSAIRAIVAERLAASGKTWEEVVHDPAVEFTREDFEKVEADLLATGYRFEVSAIVSLKEEPDKYKPLAVTVDSGEVHHDDQGRQIVGTGDNVAEQLIQSDLAARGIAIRIRQTEMGSFLTTARATDKRFDLLLAGIPVVVSAGNVEMNACRIAPANSPGAIVVGALRIRPLIPKPNARLPAPRRPPSGVSRLLRLRLLGLV